MDAQVKKVDPFWEGRETVYDDIYIYIYMFIAWSGTVSLICTVFQSVWPCCFSPYHTIQDVWRYVSDFVVPIFFQQRDMHDDIIMDRTVGSFGVVNHREIVGKSEEHY